ncbi:arrestin domain-containing protein 17-like [Contarinia nasturtii]|uniref:arrestin domain-containing protein 17-like n=1 Tax=Contarinia nasturtii TaxID=265458 RepID=UPI0012D44394|nr:arrestin domain-containing protein 17-like [Contarinia nasturtii]
MPTTCGIEYEDNPSKVFYAGQLIRGRVKFILTEDKNIRGVYVQLYGRGFTSWSEGCSRDQKTYTDQEFYLNERTYLVGGTGEMKLVSGTYIYNFQFTLPVGLPSSISGSDGFVKYAARVAFEVQFWPNKYFDNYFTVIKSSDLNHTPALREPVLVEGTYMYSKSHILCCKNLDPLKISVRSPIGGYTPGEMINLQINVNNQSRESIREFSVKFVKKITYRKRANNIQHKLERMTMAKIVVGGCEKYQNKTINAEIQVPFTPPSTDCTADNIINIEYVVCVTGVVSWLHVDPIIDLPLTIGTHSIQNNTQASIEELPGSPPSYPNDDPPTYEEAMHCTDFPF